MIRAASMPRSPGTDTGFTVVELMVTILILGILVMIAFPMYVAASASAEANACAATRRITAHADYRYFLDGDTRAPGFGDLVGDYMKDSPTCPSGGVLAWIEVPTHDNPYRRLGCSIHGIEADAPEPEASPLDTFRTLSSDLIDRIKEYREKYGRWPTRREPNSFTDLGLDPEAWGQPQDHVSYNPNGNRVNVRPEDGWVIEITQTDGRTRTLSSDSERNLIYDIKTDSWYYRSVDKDNKVDIDSMVIRGEEDNSRDEDRSEDEDGSRDEDD